MSFNDADMNNGFSYGYDQYPSYMTGDDEEIYNDRATKAGEIHDTLYPLSNSRGGWDTLGSGPLVSTATQRQGPLIGDVLRNKKEQLTRQLAQSRHPRHHQERLDSTPTLGSTTLATLFTGQTLLIILIVLLLCIVFLQYRHSCELLDMLRAVLGHQKTTIIATTD
jgi:hypothetical protein